jgi:hypothetical protein
VRLVVSSLTVILALPRAGGIPLARPLEAADGAEEYQISRLRWESPTKAAADVAADAADAEREVDGEANENCRGGLMTHAAIAKPRGTIAPIFEVKAAVRVMD